MRGVPLITRLALPLVLALAFLPACAWRSHLSGLVDPPRHLRLYDGTRVRLRLDEESEPIRYLQGCVVRVEGNKFGPLFSVKDWYVEDAGFGYGAFVGRLRVVGTRALVDDRRTNTTLVLDPVSAIRLRAYDGLVVLIVGPLVGPSEVQAMSWRVLAEVE